MDKNSVKPLKELLDSVRDIDGFPLAEDEDILALSDPPFYTACPNPYIKEFIEEYGTPYDPESDDYEKEPFVSDIGEGKRNPVYNAHPYHTKVPHKAIIPFIEHYTKPEDIVFDGFCGTGMVGIACQITGRRSILSELSPAAAFISYNYNNSSNIIEFKNQSERLLNEIENECSWMYETAHSKPINEELGTKFFSDQDSLRKGKINYTVWSDVLICPYCGNEYIFFDAAVDMATGKVRSKYECPHCNAKTNKKESERAKEIVFDPIINENIVQTKLTPVLINYNFDKKNYYKIPDEEDIKLIEKIKNLEIPYWFPSEKMMFIGEKWGDSWRKGYHFGITHVHHFFIKRSLWVTSIVYDKIKKIEDKEMRYKLLFLFTSSLQGLTKQQRYRHKSSFPNMILSGTLYIGSTIKEYSVFERLRSKLRGSFSRFLREMDKESKMENIISTSSITNIPVPPNSVDYIFTDPPFGDNLMYSELNFMWESWLKVFTNNTNEAIVNNSQNKQLDDYKQIMTNGFKEMFRVLKPNRWITIVFHNSKASVWNAIQESINRSGFIIAQVTTLDKKYDSFKQINSPGAVKNDLIINAYKPKEEFLKIFIENAGENMEIEFVRQQLEHLPVRPNIGRTEQMLYSKTLAHYVENGFKIRYNSKNFYSLLSDNFTELDGYWFMDSQFKEYNEWKSSLSLDQLKDVFEGQQVLIVSDEKSAITWIYNFLKEPKEYGEIYTAYQQVATTTDDKIPELQEILDNNFIKENGKYRKPLDQHEKEEINKNREKELDRAFNKLLDHARNQKGKIKEVRREALIHGFTKCYQEGKYHDILTIADKLYASTLEASGDIMDFVDIARIKTSGEEL